MKRITPDAFIGDHSGVPIYESRIGDPSQDGINQGKRCWCGCTDIKETRSSKATAEFLDPAVTMPRREYFWTRSSMRDFVCTACGAHWGISDLGEERVYSNELPYNIHNHKRVDLDDDTPCYDGPDLRPKKSWN